MSDFGKKFKLARESKNVTVEHIADETRISARFLRAIEKETFDVLPGGVFNRGFIRTYATCVEIDPDEAIAEYENLTNYSAEFDNDEPTGSYEPDSPERHIIPIAVGSLVVLIVLLYVFAKNTEAPTEAAGPPTPAVQTLARPAPTTRPAPIRPEAVEAATPGIQETRTGDSVRVQIQVHDATWVSVHVDGLQITDGEILLPGTRRQYTADDMIELTVGNAAGLTLLINNREVPRLGIPGQVRVLTITPYNIDRFTGS
jgi:cytoskeletal protein RodZ